MARLYDLMLLVDPNAPNGRHEQVVRDVQAMLESGGTVVASHDWGERRMAFEIDHRPEALYHLFQFESDGELLERLQHQLKIMDGVLRFRIIRLKPGAPTPPPPRDSMPRERREEREPEGRVAARAAADAAPEETVAVEEPPSGEEPVAAEAPPTPEAEAPEEPAAEKPGPEQ